MVINPSSKKIVFFKGFYNHLWPVTSLQKEFSCSAVVRFVICNNGSDMQRNNEYRIYADGVSALKNTYNLRAGDSLVLEVYSFGMTLRLEAGQSSGHPGVVTPT
jgi:hypothetical protein